jgi:S-adenosylmethionine decarboxylase
MKHFGEHLTIDGYGGSLERLSDKSIVLKTLQELPRILSMHALSDAQVFEAKGNEKKDPGGWSGYVIIMESHISLHTFPKRGFLSADVYTCQNAQFLL